MLIAEADHLVDRANVRIEQYRRHIVSMEREYRESEGAVLVLGRLERALARLQLYRDMLRSDGSALEFMQSELEKAPERRRTARSPALY